MGAVMYCFMQLWHACSHAVQLLLVIDPTMHAPWLQSIMHQLSYVASYNTIKRQIIDRLIGVFDEENIIFEQEKMLIRLVMHF